MTRPEFSALLLEAKGDKPITEFSFDVRINTSTLSAIFLAKTNYQMDIALKILIGTHSQIHLSNDRYAARIITSYNQLVDWCVYSSERSHMTKGEFAKQVGIGRDRVRSVINNTSTLMVDPFLKWAEITGYEVIIEPKGCHLKSRHRK
jgi:hypothetical protein